MILFLYGKTGTGKDYLANELSQDNYFIQPKRPTSRPMRNEEEKNYYDFYTREKFNEKVENKEIILEDEFGSGWKYGFYRDVLSQSRDSDFYVLTGDKKAAFDMKDLIGDKGIVIIVEMKADTKIRLQRIKNREDSPDMEEVRRRMLSDDKDYQDIDRIPDYYFESTNNKLGFELKQNSLIKFLKNFKNTGIKEI